MGLHQRSTFVIIEAVAFQHSTNPESFCLEQGNEPLGSISCEGVVENFRLNNESSR